MKLKAIILLILVTVIGVGANATNKITHVKSVQELHAAVQAMKSHIQLEDGKYKDLRVILNYSGTKNQNIIIEAKNPGGVMISGNSHIEILGDYIQLEGLDFNKGKRSKSEALILIEGKNNRVTNTRFRNYNEVGGVWIQLNGQYNRVDHCWFEGKTSAASYINIDVPKTGGNHHLVDRNFFARPPLGKNGGSAMRLGHGSMATFFCYTVVEFNLFEDCSGESEIMSSKSCGNIFRYNTFMNCRGALSLRQGEQGIAESNYFISNKGENNKCGGISVRNRKNLVLNNYFYGLSPKKGSVITFGAGSAPDPKRIAQGITAIHFPKTAENVIAHNLMVQNQGKIFDLVSDLGQRNKIFPSDSIYFFNNQLIGRASFVKTHTKPQNLIWKMNYYQGKTGIEETNGLIKKKLKLTKRENFVCVPEKLGKANKKWLKYLPKQMIERIEFSGVKEDLPVGIYFAPKGERGGLQEVLKKEDVGPSWKRN
jgi:poly(beta-D-mannuronate) lyase